MKKEIGGYFEFEEYFGEEFHAGALSLNCGRNALAYLIKACQYTKIYIPEYICGTVISGVERGGAEWEHYKIDEHFLPDVSFNRSIDSSEAVLLVNYYGQLSQASILNFQKRFGNIILDNTQAFFQKAPLGVDTIYSCRKFFGVSDGAYLVSDKIKKKPMVRGMSAGKMMHIFGRYETDASSYYPAFVAHEEQLKTEPIQSMSKLTHNLLRSIDYHRINSIRTRNALFLHKNLKSINALDVIIPDGIFMYPLYLPGKGERFRKLLQQEKIYVPCLWPELLKSCNTNSFAYMFAIDILPLPCDQRYGVEEMQYILQKLSECSSGEGSH